MPNVPSFIPTISMASAAMKAGGGALKKLGKKFRKAVEKSKIDYLRTPDGKAIINSKFRGGVSPGGMEKGYIVPIKKNGFPDFTDHSFPETPPPVRIKMTGRYDADFSDANKKAEFLDGTPEGYTWHHSEKIRNSDGTVTCEMQLIDTDVHDSARHSGGCQRYRAIPGNENTYK